MDPKSPKKHWREIVCFKSEQRDYTIDEHELTNLATKLLTWGSIIGYMDVGCWEQQPMLLLEQPG